MVTGWVNRVNDFLEEKNLAYRVQLIASHGHTAFHIPAKQMTAQLGDGAAIAAVTGIRTITDLRSVDIALGGQGAPIVPIGEKLLFPELRSFSEYRRNRQPFCEQGNRLLVLMFARQTGF